MGEVWWCFAGDTVCNLSKIQGTFNQHGYHSILRPHASPSGLRLVGPSLVVQQDNDPKYTSRLCKGYLTKKESDEVLRQITSPPQSPDLDPIEMVFGWVGPQSEGKAANKRSAPLGTPSRLLGKPFQVNESWPCQDCAKQKVATLKNLNYKIVCHIFFLLTT